jgi:hypothetical protein
VLGQNPIIYVKSDASGANNGTSWPDAFKSLQDALNASYSGTVIWVAGGTYTPISSDNDPRNGSFRLKSGVAVYGGFSGTETSLSQRNWSAHETILSGDLAGNDVATGSGATLQMTNYGENSYHVIYCEWVDNTSVLNGFTIRGGNAEGSRGGGICVVNSSPVIVNCKIQYNTASGGGAAFHSGYNNSNFLSTYFNCLIINNKASEGGGMWNYFTSAELTNCTISGNAAGIGGGIYQWTGGTTLKNSILWGNYSPAGNQVYDYCGSVGLYYSDYSNQSDDMLGYFCHAVTADENSISVDPKFLNPGNDFRLGVTSPCIDAGNNDYITESFDIRGEGFERKLSKIDHSPGVIDIGAYEYKEGTDPTGQDIGNQTRNTDPDLCQYTTVGAEFDLVTFGYNYPGATVSNDFNQAASLAGAIFPKGSTTVVWTVADASGFNNTATYSFSIIVEDHQNPTITCKGDQIRNTDPNLCQYTTVGAEFDPVTFGDNCPGAIVSNDFNHAASLAGAIFPKGSTTVVWTITDASGFNNIATCSLIITVVNTAPIINSIDAPLAPLPINTPLSINLNFTDYENNVTNALIMWDDGTSSTFSPVLLNSFTATHTYEEPDVYTLSVTLTDACGSTASSMYQYIVIYDPNAGFVTGSGSINSPLGAYIPEPTLTGKASFGFESKYQKGKSIPDGHTAFKFQAGKMNFSSTSYDWLVVSGSKVIYKGTGTINGAGNYGFLLSAIDGSKADLFRIKIWDKETGATVYDNQLGEADDANPTCVITVGNIIVHSTGKSADLVKTTYATDKAQLLVYPNPFSDKLRFEFVAPANVYARIDLFDLTGRMVQMVFNKDVRAGIYYNAEFRPNTSIDGIYFYSATIGNQVFIGKVMYKK